MRPSTIVAVGIVVMVSILALMLYPRVRYLIPPTSPQGQAPGGLPIPQWAIAFGRADAPITVIELYDLHCPYCAMAQEQLDPLYRQMLQEGKLRLILLDLIVHPEAAQAHQYLHCAYKQLGNNTLDLILQAYQTFSKQGPDAQMRLLERYNCTNAPTKADFDNAVRTLLNHLTQRGVSIRQVGTPTFIIVKNETINVVVGADVPKVVSLLSQ
ncbi:MAG: thioredoxin domain-containing protein [Pyrobaculum sp.]